MYRSPRGYEPGRPQPPATRPGRLPPGRRRNNEPPEFDLILMDIQMPVLTGDKAVSQIRTLERQHGWPHTMIIARSANTAEEDQRLFRQCGMDGCIPKCGNVAKQARPVRTPMRARALSPHISATTLSTPLCHHSSLPPLCHRSATALP